MGHKDDPFILASQANQLFYVDDSMESRWSIALSAEPRIISPDNDQDEVETLEELNTTNNELVEIDDSEGLIGLYARKDIDDVWIDNNWVRILQVFFNIKFVFFSIYLGCIITYFLIFAIIEVILLLIFL